MNILKAVKLHKNGTLIKQSGTENWTVQEEFTWKIYNSNGAEEYITVPQGFVTDFGSIPKLFHAVFSPTRYLSYILHDYGYKGGHKIRNGQQLPMTRKEVDTQLRKCLELEGMSFIGRWAVYISVRIGGAFFF